MQFRKKPITIDAELFHGTAESAGHCARWCNGSAAHVGGSSKSKAPSRYVVDIETLEGTMRAEPGDWIIRGVKGEFYPCKPDIFAATYEAALPGATLAPPDRRQRDETQDSLRMMLPILMAQAEHRAAQIPGGNDDKSKAYDGYLAEAIVTSLWPEVLPAPAATFAGEDRPAASAEELLAGVIAWCRLPIHQSHPYAACIALCSETVEAMATGRMASPLYDRVRPVRPSGR